MSTFRRILCTFLAAALLLAAVPASAAGGFDLSCFNLRDYFFKTQTETVVYINPNEYVDPLRNYGQIFDITMRSTAHFSYVFPYVYLRFGGNEVTDTSYTLTIELANDQYPELNIGKLEFIVGGTTYVFTVVADDRSNGVKKNGTTYYEDVFIHIDEDNRVMMDRILELQEPVRVIAYGSTQTIEFTMGENIIAKISGMYRDYLAANGMALCGKGMPMTIQDPLTKFLGEPVTLKTPVTDFAGKSSAEWMADDASRALLVSLLAYDLFTAMPANADVLGYMYNACYAGQTADGTIHVAIQTAAGTYYFVRSQSGTVVSIRAGADRLTDAALTQAMTELGVSYVRLDSEVLMQTIVLQTQYVTQYNAL